MAAIVAVSDLHLDHSTHGVARFEESARVLRASAERAVEVKASAWLFLGDACDPDSGPVVFRCVEALLKTAAFLVEHKVPAVFLAGNHDVIEDGSGDTTLSPLRALPVHVADEPLIVHVAGLPRIVAFPFTASSHPYDPAEWARAQVEQSRHDVMVIEHLHVPGVQPGEETKELARGRSVTFPLRETRRAKMRLGGHYHRAQDFDPGDGGPPLHIVGSPCRLTFSEEGNECGFLVASLP